MHERYGTDTARWFWGRLHGWGLVPLLGALVGVSACLDRPLGASPPITTNQFVDRITQTSVDEIDLLFMIDNSASMSDKQAILRLAVPDLVGRLVNPACVDAEGRRGETPPPGEPCPAGQSREFGAVESINVAVVSSSLGDAGANDACSERGYDRYAPDRVDLAHLIGSLPRGRSSGANERGFLEWRPGTDEQDFSARFERMVESVGESGCGWEASLESWYRFLVDPFPYRELVRARCANATSGSLDCVQPATDGSGQIVLDEELLAQRAAFLRPNSLVAIIMLSDENDCSVAVGGSSWAVVDTRRRMNRASAACDSDPNAPCCYMCGTGVPEGCAADPVCDVAPAAGIAPGRLAAEDDGANLRCYDQKRRFGHDFLYPTSRYVNALREVELCVGHADLGLEGCPDGARVRNPLFSGGRDRSLVFLGGIVGVPWQAIASGVDATGDAITDPTVLRFKTADELQRDGTWSEIVGSPGVPAGAGGAGRPRVPPRNPFMVESELARAGVEQGNAVNGREYVTDAATQPGTPMDLQYSCIFPLPGPRDCSTAAAGDGCDCSPTDFDRPLCEREPGVSAPGTTQYWAKAYPGTRQLQVLEGFGQSSIVASICARNVDVTTQDSRSDFGYRPAVDSIVERLKERLGNRCLPRGLLAADPEEPVACTLVESVTRPTEPCECDLAIARRVPDEQTSELIRAELARDIGRPCGSDDPTCSNACLCEVLQVQEVPGRDPVAALRACQQDIDASGVEGWCYVADTDSQQVGNPELVAACPPTQRQLLRFVGQGLRRNTTTFVACQGSSLAAQRSVAGSE